MKKLLTILLSALLLLALTSCNLTESSGDGGGGSGSSKTGPGSYYKEKERTGIIDIDSITTENWKQVVKENFEFDLNVPDSWEIKEAKSAMGAHIAFSCNATKEEVLACFDAIFEQLKELGASRIIAHFEMDKHYGTYSEASNGSLSGLAFHFMMNDEFSKELYIDFQPNETLNSDGKWYVDEVEFYIKSDGDWSAPSGHNGFQKLEAYSGMTGVPTPDGMVVSDWTAYYDDYISIGFIREDGSEITAADLDAYAATIYDLCLKAADKGETFWYHAEDDKITVEYKGLADAKKNDGNYRIFYKLNGEYIYVGVKLQSGRIHLYVSDHVV